MLKLLLAVLRSETELTIAFKAKGHNVVKPSIILVGLVGLFYMLSGIDLVPERFVKPLAFGLVDDLLVLGACVVYVMSNVSLEGGVESVRNIKIPDLSKLSRKNEVSSGSEGDKNISSVVPVADTSSNVGSSEQTMVGDTTSTVSVAVGSSDTDQQAEHVDVDNGELSTEEEEFFSEFFKQSGTNS